MYLNELLVVKISMLSNVNIRKICFELVHNYQIKAEVYLRKVMKLAKK